MPDFVHIFMIYFSLLKSPDGHYLNMILDFEYFLF